MADNITLNTMTGGSVAATDERSIASATVHVQRVVPLGGSSVTNGHVTVTNSATTIKAATETRHCLTVINFQTVPIYVGAATVTTSTGLRLDPGASLTVHATCEIQGITSAAYTAAGEDDKTHYLEEVSA
jgi:hypothetical protein